jgi:hypothetical protein
MATTTNYGWTTPDDTALVKDGASAIRTLGSSIDTSLNTALGTKKAGLVLLNTTTFSGVASQSVNDVFSSTYDNYVIFISDLIASTGTPNIYIRLRASGADNSAAQYQINFIVRSTGAFSSGSSASGTAWDFGAIDATNRCFRELKLSSVNKAQTTGMQTMTADTYSNSGTTIYALAGGAHAVSTAFTGLTIYPSANNISGVISVYGLAK